MVMSILENPKQQKLPNLCLAYLGSLHSKKTTDKQAIRVASMSTLGFIIDDPSSPNEFSEKVLIHFGKGALTSCTSSYKPRCSFIATLNYECLEAFASLPKR